MKKVVAFFVVALLVAPLGDSWADDKRILDVMLKKGIITKQEYDDILKEAEKEDKEPFKGAVKKETYKDDTPTVSTEEAQSGKKYPVGSYPDLETRRGGIENLRKNDYRNVWTNIDTILKHNERISVGLVALKAQYNADNTDRKPFPASSPGDTSNFQGPTRDENGFRIRAAEIYVTGRLTPWSTYYFEVDFARQTEITLNSMYMDFYAKDIPYLQNIYPYVSKIRVGQFREPFGIEQGTSQGLLDFVNRAYYTDLKAATVDTRPGDPTLNPFGKDNSTGFLQQLDMGIELTHKAPQLPWSPEIQWAVINGAGRNFNDNNADKDLTGRLILAPADGLKVYLAGYTGTAFFTNTATATAASTCPSAGQTACRDIRKTRQGVMYTYIPPFFDNRVKLQAEYIEGADNGFRRRTAYQYITFRPFDWLLNFEPAARAEFFTIDTNRKDSTMYRYTVGFNYYFHTNVKFTMNYEFKHDDNEGSNGNAGGPITTSAASGFGGGNSNNKNFLTTQIQFRY